MANNLLKAGHDVVVFDVAEAAVKVATDAGATAAATPREIAEQASTIITMLPSTRTSCLCTPTLRLAFWARCKRCVVN